MSGFDEKELEDIWASISEKQQVKSPYPLKNFKKGERLFQLVTDYLRNGSLLSLEQCSFLSSEEKAQLMEFLRKKTVKEQLDVDWKISVVVGNSYTHKSLHPIASVSVDGDKYEFDMEGVAAMRLALAKALQSTQRYGRDE